MNIPTRGFVAVLCATPTFAALTPAVAAHEKKKY